MLDSITAKLEEKLPEKEFAYFVSQVTAAVRYIRQASETHKEEVKLVANDIARRLEEEESLRAVNAYVGFYTTCNRRGSNLDTGDLTKTFISRM